MTTIILPGYSLHNKDWADESAKLLSDSNVFYWKHWKLNSPISISVSSPPSKFIELIKEEKINILAKSVGTYVASKIISTYPRKINKVILCGIPITNLLKNDIVYKRAFNSAKSENLIIFQNDKDPLGQGEAVKQIIKNMDFNFEVLINSRSDHNYPFYNDFKKFLG